LSEENRQDFTKEVKDYIEEAKRGGSYISSSRERDQLRANLRYWANYVYSIDKTFPDTELAPSSVADRSFLPTTTIGVITIVVLGIAVLAGGIFASRANFTNSENPATKTALPLMTPTAVPPTQALQTSEPGLATEAPVSPSGGSDDVVLTSPQNGDNVPPRIVFTGTYTNLKPDSSIHILLVKSDTVFPVKDYVTISQDFTRGEWKMEASLYQNPDDLERAESFVVVPAVCFDNSCRETLSNSVETGIAIDSLPSQFAFELYQDTSRVVFRNAYQAINEARLVYSIFYANESSYDLYTCKPDGSDARRIKLTPDYSELYPNLSPDGTKIVYVKRLRETSGAGHIYAIAIMDSNGENDYEITNRTKNVLESPQWSPDSLYVSYAMGDTSQSSNNADWNIHIYEFSTQIDTTVFEKPEKFDHRYHTWLPNVNSIIFNARPQTTGTSGFDIVPINSSEKPSSFFDTDQEDIWPSIKSQENGYLLTYTVVNPDTTHDIYAVLDSDQQFPFDGSPIRLTFRRAGETVDGSKIGNADYPISDPNSNSIYYLRNLNIYKLDFTIKGGKIELIIGPKNDDERYGDLVVETGLKEQILGFDIGLMEAFFPIQ